MRYREIPVIGIYIGGLVVSDGIGHISGVLLAVLAAEPGLVFAHIHLSCRFNDLDDLPLRDAVCWLATGIQHIGIVGYGAVGGVIAEADPVARQRVYIGDAPGMGIEGAQGIGFVNGDLRIIQQVQLVALADNAGINAVIYLVPVAVIDKGRIIQRRPVHTVAGSDINGVA